MARSGDRLLQPLAEDDRGQAGGERSPAVAPAAAKRRAVEAAGEREGEELGAVAHFGGEAEDEGGEQQAASRSPASAGGARIRPEAPAKSKAERGQQGHRARS